MHWELVAERRTTKIAEGEFIEDELLPQLRDDKDMNRLGREFLKAVERGNAPAVGAYIEEGISRPITKTGRRKKRRCIFLPPSKRERCCASFSIADLQFPIAGQRRAARIGTRLFVRAGPRRRAPACHQRAQAGGSARDQAHPAAENVPLKTA